jgi:L-threonylcarbamoyladenylate synthase
MGVPRWHWGEPVAPLAELLAGGGFLAIPTESSYGLAADPRSAAGVAAIARCKGRAADKALPVVAASEEQLVALGADLGAREVRCLVGLWPAALSVAVPLRRPLPAAGPGGTLAVRLPDHARLRRLLGQLGGALTATSANRAGEPPILDPDELVPLLEGLPAAIVDDGRLPGGEPSTLVAVREGRLAILRAGRYPSHRLEEVFRSVCGNLRG